MSTLLRIFCLVSLTLAGEYGLGMNSTFASHEQPEYSTVRRLSLVAGVEAPAPALRRVKSDSAVRSASLGADGKTINVTLRNGVQAAILPAGPASIARASTTSLPLRPEVESPAPPRGRALILEPFATELGLPASVDDSEIHALQFAGFQVDVWRNDAVSVKSMTRLSNYQVVYLNTHSGVNPQGEGVAATGQIANHDPAADALLKEGSALLVSVAGSDQIYYGIVSNFIRRYVGHFPPNAMVFINGCTFLRATLFWDALADKGVKAFVSWDDIVEPPVDTTAASLVFAGMSSGGSVAGAIDETTREGYGTQQLEGKTAHLSYLGDGALTWFPAVVAPSPTLLPTSTPEPPPSPAATPVSSPAPRASPTPTPAPSFKICRRYVDAHPLACRAGAGLD